MAPAWVRPYLAGVLSAAIIAGSFLLATRPRHDAVEVLIATPATGAITVAVSGEVARPGLYQLPPGSRVGDLVQRAGGATERADPATPSRALLLREEMHVHVPSAPAAPPAVAPMPRAAGGLAATSVPAAPSPIAAGSVEPPRAPDATLTVAPGLASPTPPPAERTSALVAPPNEATTVAAATPAATTPLPTEPPPIAPSPVAPTAIPPTEPPPAAPRGRTPTPALTGPVNLNTANAAELERLPGIGTALAARIIADRERNGPNRRIEDLDRVSGIGPATIARLRPLVTV
jgi:competence ComEA-like helix-hairpin-helix protein